MIHSLETGSRFPVEKMLTVEIRHRALGKNKSQMSGKDARIKAKEKLMSKFKCQIKSKILMAEGTGCGVSGVENMNDDI